MKIGMMGAGVMAGRMTETFQKMDNMETYALASAFPEECERFVKELGWQKSYETYEELLSDPEIDIVYIPVPTRLHPDLTKLALRYHKPVLCEKPLCVNTKETREVIELAAKEKTFMAEGLWCNYMPSRHMIDDVIQSGVLGELTDVEIVMRNNVIHERRFESLDMAAGALMDVGSYTIGAMMISHLGTDVELTDCKYTLLPNGLDESNELYFQYKNGPKVKVINNVHSDVYEKYCWFNGTKGKMLVEGTSNPKGIKVYDLEGNLIQDMPVPPQISGYEYQWMACERALKEGRLEPEELPHEEILAFIGIMDAIREKMGLKFPFEE